MLSHLSALAVAGLTFPTAPVHVSVPTARCPRGGTGVIAHRSDRRQVTIRRGPLEALVPERSLVDAWAWAHTPRRNPSTAQELPLVRRALIDGVRSRTLRVPAVRRESVLPGPPEAPAWVQQHRVQLPDGRTVHLDAAYLEAKVAIELDGAAFHGSREARERDLRRDAALAALGWVVLRFSYQRLTRNPEGCRRDIVAAVVGRLTR